MQFSLLAQLDQTPLAEDIILTSDDRFPEFLEDFHKSKWFTFDTETEYYDNPQDGLNPFRGSIRLFQICLPNKKIAILDLQKDKEYLPEILRHYQNCTVIGHNVAFDLSFVYAQYGVLPKDARCTQVMSLVLHAGIKHYKHALKACAKRELGIDISKDEQKSDWRQELATSQLNYAASDVRTTHQLYLTLANKLQMENLADWAKVECQAIIPFVFIRCNGVPIDIFKAESAYNTYMGGYQKYADLFEQETGIQESLAASQLVDWIEKKYGFRTQAIAKTGKNKGQLVDSTGAEVIEKYKEQIPCLNNLSNARQLKKLADYIKAYLDSAKDYGHCDRVHGGYSSLGRSATGRSTCGKEDSEEGTTSNGSSEILCNLQNVPKYAKVDGVKYPNIRELFCASEGKTLGVFDLSAAHLV